MSIQKVREYLSAFNAEGRITELDSSSATVQLAAEALGCEPRRLAKTLSFRIDSGCILVVAAGDAKIDNHSFKTTFGVKAKMLSPEEVENEVGHAVGGVCPFALAQKIPVYLDVSLQRFDTVFPAAGSASSAVRLSCDELFVSSAAAGWEDVCRPKEA